VQHDLFSLGIVLCELLAGQQRLPEHAAVSLGARQSGVDAGWDALFLRVLAPNRSLMPESARQMADLLRLLAAPPDAAARSWLATFVRQKRP
jgi:hypothetical protein